MKEERFWRVTPRQYLRQMKGRASELRRAHNDRAWLAWHAAALPRMKKFPELKKLVIRDPAAAQTAEQMMAIAKQWALALGGTISGKPN